jgi:hypothetical protein
MSLLSPYAFDLQEHHLLSGTAADSQSRAVAEPELNPQETDSNPHGTGDRPAS